MKKNKQERKFQTQWTTNRKWLVYSDEENKMYFTLCKNSNVDSVFTKGTNNIKLEAVKQHVRLVMLTKCIFKNSQLQKTEA